MSLIKLGESESEGEEVGKRERWEKQKREAGGRGGGRCVRVRGGRGERERGCTWLLYSKMFKHDWPISSGLSKPCTDTCWQHLILKIERNELICKFHQLCNKNVLDKTENSTPEEQCELSQLCCSWSQSEVHKSTRKSAHIWLGNNYDGRTKH